jgi:spore germination protein YaaH
MARVPSEKTNGPVERQSKPLGRRKDVGPEPSTPNCVAASVTATLAPPTMRYRHPFFLPILLFLIVAPTIHAKQPKSLFYLTRDPVSVRSFLAHSDKVDILVPAWYVVDANGLVSGGPNPLVLETARQHHVPVMPIVANSAFVQEDFHKLLKNPEAYSRMISELLRACKENGYSGFQFDFENVSWTDRDALTMLVREAASSFHREGLQLTIATVPNAPGAPGEGGFSAWIYENWRGAYDLKALAEAVDLICLMTYDQHTRWTAPGPVAGWAWTTGNLDYALKVVPPEKLSLGIPLYGYHWFAGTPVKIGDKPGDKPNPSAEYISTDDALDLAKAYNGHIEWDSTDRSAWFYFYRDDMREWIFFTDARTFRERYTLVKERGLQGFCSWVLGTEDLGIWDSLPSHN